MKRTVYSWVKANLLMVYIYTEILYINGNRV